MSLPSTGGCLPLRPIISQRRSFATVAARLHTIPRPTRRSLSTSPILTPALPFHLRARRGKGRVWEGLGEVKPAGRLPTAAGSVSTNNTNSHEWRPGAGIQCATHSRKCVAHWPPTQVRKAASHTCRRPGQVWKPALLFPIRVDSRCSRLQRQRAVRKPALHSPAPAHLIPGLRLRGLGACTPASIRVDSCDSRIRCCSWMTCTLPPPP